MKKNKPQTTTAAFVYYAEGADEANIPQDVLVELYKELDTKTQEGLCVQVLENALVVGDDIGNKAGVMLIHTVHVDNHGKNTAT